MQRACTGKYATNSRGPSRPRSVARSATHPITRQANAFKWVPAGCDLSTRGKGADRERFKAGIAPLVGHLGDHTDSAGRDLAPVLVDYVQNGAQWAPGELPGSDPVAAAIGALRQRRAVRDHAGRPVTVVPSVALGMARPAYGLVAVEILREREEPAVAVLDLFIWALVVVGPVLGLFRAENTGPSARWPAYPSKTVVNADVADAFHGGQSTFFLSEESNAHVAAFSRALP